MGASYTTEDGYTLTIHHTLYVDYGLPISKDGVGRFYNPCCLSNDSWGNKPNPDKHEDWDEAEEASLGGDDNAFIPWDDADWVDRLQSEADELIEAYIG